MLKYFDLLIVCIIQQRVTFVDIIKHNLFIDK